jgi:hypothetical protein
MIEEHVDKFINTYKQVIENIHAQQIIVISVLPQFSADKVKSTLTNNEIDLLPEDKIYIFSDGFVDQFGGPNGKKLKYNYFRKLLLNNHKKPMPKQKEAINTFFEEWRTGFEQIDDVCIIGVAI